MVRDKGALDTGNRIFRGGQTFLTILIVGNLDCPTLMLEIMPRFRE